MVLVCGEQGSILHYFLYENLNHVPSNCIVVMVHVVKGRQYGAYTVAPQSQRWSLRPTLDLDSDKFRCFNHRDELDSAVQLVKTWEWPGIAYAHVANYKEGKSNYQYSIKSYVRIHVVLDPLENQNYVVRSRELELR
jgi:hypothetical protein